MYYVQSHLKPISILCKSDCWLKFLTDLPLDVPQPDRSSRQFLFCDPLTSRRSLLANETSTKYKICSETIIWLIWICWLRPIIAATQEAKTGGSEVQDLLRLIGKLDTNQLRKAHLKINNESQTSGDIVQWRGSCLKWTRPLVRSSVERRWNNRGISPFGVQGAHAGICFRFALWSGAVLISRQSHPQLWWVEAQSRAMLVAYGRSQIHKTSRITGLWL